MDVLLAPRATPEATMSWAMERIAEGVRRVEAVKLKTAARQMLRDPSCMEFRVGRGASTLGPDEGLAFVASGLRAQALITDCALFARWSPIGNLKAARIAFRWQRRFDRDEMREAA